ncbi:hypothetical protein DVR12_06600 [Chitinophaga silvatica]|uniref:Uncharacterized protein n=1 Tax=Chitinophaga silvatica TaxID=2282649 RepID=A0A3E1YE57_9BACT|nr:hypothetical protein [Chitinophaga silvatica]RFS24855.1 hypothetical protein DVR12_06600 [Chitinophaga silvatica]
MTSSEYLQNKLTEAIKLFPTICFRHEYNIYSETHFIEMSPASFYKNEKFDKWIDETYFTFIKIYPDDLSIFPKERRKLIENCEFEIQGSLYKEPRKRKAQLTDTIS